MSHLHVRFIEPDFAVCRVRFQFSYLYCAKPHAFSLNRNETRFRSWRMELQGRTLKLDVSMDLKNNLLLTLNAICFNKKFQDQIISFFGEANIHWSGHSSKQTFIEADIHRSRHSLMLTFIKADIRWSRHSYTVNKLVPRIGSYLA